MNKISAAASQSQLEQTLARWTKKLYHKRIADCSPKELYDSVLCTVKEYIAARPVITGQRKVYYISAEFLIGKLLDNNLINLGLRDEMEQILSRQGKSLNEVEEAEPEPSLGNGGLGRLAACFLDSIATLGLPGDGIGLNYHFGLFRHGVRGNGLPSAPGGGAGGGGRSLPGRGYAGGSAGPL